MLSLLIGAIGGGFAGYRIGVKSKTQQKQKAKDGAKQRQEMDVERPVTDGEMALVDTVVQKQKAGHNAEQIQIGRIKNGK